MFRFARECVRRSALVAAALVVFAGQATARDAGTATDAGDAATPADARADGSSSKGDAGTTADAGGIVDTYIDPGCGCRTSNSTNGARTTGVAAVLLALATRRRRSRHSVA
jgi:MYXO-CTERM domain-containing protein